MELRGLTGDDFAGWARRNDAELVDFHAIRGSRMTARVWLETVASIDGRSKRDGFAVVDAILRRSGLAAFATAPFTSLTPFARVSIAVAECAVGIAGQTGARVVLPEPPLPWPHRHELRRMAIELLANADLWIHACDAAELAPLMPRESITDASGVSLAAADGQRAIVLRVYGSGEPYLAFREALEGLGVSVAGGPIAHVLSTPPGVTPREVLALAFDAGIDVLEVREATR